MDNVKWPLSQFHHVHVAAKDINVPEVFLRGLGIPLGGYNHPGEFKVADGIDLEEFWARDYRFCRVGTAHLQFMSPHRDGRYRQFLNQNGNRVYSMGYVVNDVDAAEAEMLNRGLKIRTRGRHSDGWGFTYFETLDVLGVLICVRQSAKNEALTDENTSTGTFATLGEFQVVVRDMSAAEDEFSKAGFAFAQDESHSDAVSVDGMSSNAFQSLTRRVARIGPVSLRLASPGAQESTLKQFADLYEKRPFSLGFKVDDLDAAEATAKERGLVPLIRVRQPEGRGFTCFDTLDKLGFNLAIQKE